MQALNSVVEDFKASGPKTGKFGEYWHHTYVIDGKKLTKFGKTDQPEAAIGQTVLVTFETKRTEKGEFHNIDKLTVMEDTSESKSTAPIEIKTVATFTQNTPSTKISLSTLSLSAKDLSIARMNAVTSAVSLLGQDSNLKSVLSLADQIVDYTTAPYNNKEVLDLQNKRGEG